MRIAARLSKVGVFLVTYFLLYFPLLIIAILSFNESQKSYQFTNFSFQWYSGIIENDQLLTAIINTLTVALLSTVISTIIGTLSAIGIVGLSKKNKRAVMFLNNVPVLNPDIVTGISLMIVFSFIGIKFGFPTMLMAHVFFSIPFVILTVLPKLKSIDPNLYDAAVDLGCSPITAVVKVIIPAIRTSIIGGALIAFTMSIDDFVISYFTTGNGYSNFSIWIYSRLGRRSFSPSAYAYNTIITLGTLMVLVVLNLRNMRKKR